MQDALSPVRACPLPARKDRHDDVCELSATEMASKVRIGDISAHELVEAHIARIEAVNPKLNAVVVKRYDAARGEARDIDHRRVAGEALPPLAGVPITIKECLDFEGTASTFGLPSRRDAIAASDEAHVARLRQAGAIVLGKTNVAQLLMFVECDNPIYGRTNNPWNLDRTCGGSSGGEGAIIAAGGSALGLGTDIGGSCRYPAGFCGIVGFKATAGRMPDRGRYSMSFGQQAIASQVGLLARNVDDIAAGLSVADGARPTSLEPQMPLGSPASVDPGTLRIGFYTDDGIMQSSPAVRRAVREAAKHLADAGASVVEWSLPDPEQLLHLAFALFSADSGAHFKSLLAGGPVDPALKPLLMLAGRSRPTLRLIGALLRAIGQPTLAGMSAHFGYTSARDYWQLVEALDDYREHFAAAMDLAPGGPLDLVLGPACALAAFRHGAAKDLGLAGVNTILYNALGYPAGVVPVTRVREAEESQRPHSKDIVQKAAKPCEDGSAGLPVGVQIAARPWREHQALAAMRIIEQEAERHPDFPAHPPL
ncbi:MAG: fatty acid amide hydrolase [Caballeronia sp.]|nr:fatty acid amide hydrolase [Caballeronia sp.]